MKNLILLFGFFMSITIAQSQTFSLLESDVEGDNMIPIALDLKSISYSMDIGQDSLWLKIEFYNDILPDVGIYMGIDNDLDINNGTAWNSNAGNTSMKCDKVIAFTRNSMLETEIDCAEPYVNNITEVDTCTLVVNFKLSDLDSDAHFNFIIGTGSFSGGGTYDDIPDNSYMTITSTSISENKLSKQLSIYPNPSTGQFIIKGENINSVSIVDISGKVILEKDVNTNSIDLDLRGYSKTVYFVKVRSAKGIQIEKVIVK